MNETDLRERLFDLAVDAPSSPTAPHELLRRARRRIVFVITSSVVIAALIAGAGLVGARALEGSNSRPADDSGELVIDSFAEAHGWIAFKRGSEIIAFDPSDPTHQVLLGPSEGRDPIAWASDGSKLLLHPEDQFSCGGCAEPPNLFVLRGDGSQTRVVPPTAVDTGGVATWGAFSPDGTEIVYAADGSSRGPYVVDADGGQPRSLGQPCDRVEVNGRSVELCGEPLPEAATWAPDGSRIAWVDFVEDSDTYGHHASVLSFVNPDGSGLLEEVALLPGEGANSLVWSPDGSQLAFWLSRSEDGRGRMYVINADGSDLRDITQGGDNRWPTWSPDGSRIAFVHNGMVCTIDPDGTDMETIPIVVPDGAIAWNPVR
jgi:Tol biopolymer transport system component